MKKHVSIQQLKHEFYRKPYQIFIGLPWRLRFRRVWVVIVSFLLLGAIFSGQTAYAQGSNNDCNGSATYLDLDEDGKPEAVTAIIEFSPNPIDEITIFDGNNDLTLDLCWREAVDFDDETWLFDAGADGKTNLIIVFQQDGEQLIADLYDDRDGDGVVAYKIVDKQVTITESPHWTVRVVAPDGWWVNDSKINYNLELYIDGDVEAAFGADTFIDQLSNNGIVDFEIYIYDEDHDGKPEYDLRYLPLLPNISGLGGYNTHLMVNLHDNEVTLEDPFLWPFVGTNPFDHPSHVVRRDHDSALSPILINWHASKIIGIQEFVASRANENNCFFYSNIRPTAGQLNDINFEAPFCFYDLAEDKDRQPELIIRNMYWVPNDKMFVFGQFPYPMSQIRYSWDQDNDGNLDYGVGLAGRNEIESTIKMLDFEFTTIAFDDFPFWVTEREWDAVVFARAKRKGGYRSSEGIYGADLSLNFVGEYLTGQANVSPIQTWQEQEENFPSESSLQGLHLERNFEFGQPPYLYFSPVDRALHLLGAEDGLWQIDEQASIEYQNLNADPYIDQWTYVENKKSTKQLFHAGDWVIYASEQQVKVAQAKVPKAIFETLPPRTHQEWLELQQKLDSQEKEFAPGEFESIVDQFEAQVVNNATLHGFRFTDDGFRFVMELSKDFHVATGQDWLGIKELSSAQIRNEVQNDYVVSYQNNRFQIEPLSPGEPVLVAGSFQLDQEAIALQPLEITAALENKGFSDIPALAVYLHAARADGQAKIVSESKIPLLGENTSKVSFIWAPPTEGEWKLWLTLGESEEYSTTDEVKIEVAASPTPSVYWSLQRVGTTGGVVALGGLAAILAIIALGTTRVMLPSLLEGESK